VRMESYNRGPIVGGPYDGKEHDVLIWPPDWPDGVSEERLTVCRLFSRDFPEGAVYHWDGTSWVYRGPTDTEDKPGEHRRLFEVFGMDTEPPL